MLKRPRLKLKAPIGLGFVRVPESRRLPPSSASRPRPWTRMGPGAVMVRSSTGLTREAPWPELLVLD
jgi:hypothetical protein